MTSRYAVYCRRRWKGSLLQVDVSQGLMKLILPTASCRCLWLRDKQPAYAPRFRSAASNLHGKYRSRTSKMNSSARAPTCAVSGAAATKGDCEPVALLAEGKKGGGKKGTQTFSDAQPISF